MPEEARKNIFKNESENVLKGWLSPGEITHQKCAEAFEELVKETVNTDTGVMWRLLRVAHISENLSQDQLTAIVELLDNGMVKGIDMDMQEKLRKNCAKTDIARAYQELNNFLHANRCKLDAEIQAVIAETAKKHMSLKERRRWKCSLV